MDYRASTIVSCRISYWCGLAMNLLYVEDDPALRYSIARELRDRGHTVHEAESAEKALVLLAEYEMDVLITDLGLPGEAGEVFAADARAARPHLRVVFATGLDRLRSDIPAASASPVILRKPYTCQSLVAALSDGTCLG
jgi:DNA-binding response OmpR family regulator